MAKETITSLANRWNELPSDHKNKDPIEFIQSEWSYFTRPPDYEKRVSEFYKAIKTLGYQGEARIKEATEKVRQIELEDLIIAGLTQGHIQTGYSQDGKGP